MVLQYDLDVISDRSPFIAGQTFKRRLELGPHAQQLGGTFGALAVMPINGNLVGATAPAPELQKVYYYNRVARRQYRRAYRRGYYGGYAYNPGCRAARKSALFPNRVARA
ncbi:MAG: hypothetical protein WBE05_15940 [Pseudolabrys sp.]